MYTNPVTPTPGKVLGASIVATTGAAILPQTSANPLFAWLKPTNIALLTLVILALWTTVYVLIARLKKNQ